MEILGMRAAKAGFEAAEMDVSPRRELMPITFAAEAFSNTAYYGLVGFVRSENAITAGATLGIAARIGAVVLPRPLGLGESPSARSAQTKLLTVAWYLAGGIVAGLVRQRGEQYSLNRTANKLLSKIARDFVRTFRK